jgi:lactoylglutathione lyase
VTSLNLVVIRSADSERAIAFYRLLGMTFEKHRHGKGPEHFACELDQSVFEIYPRKDETDSTASVRLGFCVASVDKTMADLEAAGMMIVSPPKDSPWGRRAVVDDPDGHRIELTELR